MVKTDSGYKAIADIRTGDSVFAKDEKSGATGYKTVTAQYSNPYKETVYVEISDSIGNSQTIITNTIHPFYSNGKWIQAGRLKKGDMLLSENGQTQTVRSVTIKRQPLTAYNLTVADWHTYLSRAVRRKRMEFGFIMIALIVESRQSVIIAKLITEVPRQAEQMLRQLDKQEKENLAQLVARHKYPVQKLHQAHNMSHL